MHFSQSTEKFEMRGKTFHIVSMLLAALKIKSPFYPQNDLSCGRKDSKVEKVADRQRQTERERKRERQRERESFQRRGSKQCRMCACAYSRGCCQHARADGNVNCQDVTQ